MPDDALALRARALRCSFGTVRAVVHVDLDVMRGELVVLVGPSGSGKTTTLRLLAGFERPDSGTVELGGRLVSGPDRYEPPEGRRIGFVAQDLALFPHLDAWHNIAYGLRGWEGGERDARVAELLDMVGLSGFGARMPHQLSGGMAQRVALCRALAPHPAILLLDEPFASLDQVLRVGLRDDMRRILRETRQTAVMVTHDQEEALSMGDRVVIMREGVVAQVGTPEEVHDRPADPWVGTFLGHGCLVPMIERDGLAETPLGTVRTAARVPGATQLLVRPEHLQLVPQGAGTCDALVEARRFEGSAVMVALRAGGIGGLWATCPADRRGLQVGDQVGLVLRDQPPPVAFVAAATTTVGS